MVGLGDALLKHLLGKELRDDFLFDVLQTLLFDRQVRCDACACCDPECAAECSPHQVMSLCAVYSPTAGEV